MQLRIPGRALSGVLLPALPALPVRAVLRARSSLAVLPFLLALLVLVAEAPRPAAACDPASPPWAPAGPDTFEECTIVVVSAEASADGRPLLWKNRDAGFLDNEAVFFSGGKHSYLSLTNANTLTEAWVGVNDAGFAILNALSYNVPDSTYGGITNGQLMKLALETCATVNEFEALLHQIAYAQGRENPANLGVIDAQGGAAVFEVGNRHHFRFDAGGGEGAAGGFLVRANFSLAYDTLGTDTWRFRRASALMRQAATGGGVERREVLEIARDLGTAQVDPYPLPCECAPPGYPDAFGYVDTQETINRVSTVASGLIHGAAAGEDPGLATLFLALGQPAVTPFVPLWVPAGATPPEMDGTLTAPFCDESRRHRAEVYDYAGNWRFLNTKRLLSPDRSQPLHLGHVWQIEHDAHLRADSLLAQWRRQGFDPKAMSVAEKSLARAMFNEYKAPQGGDEPALWVLVGPNPTAGEATIVAQIPGPIDVFDVRGRRVARLAASSGAAGGLAGAFGTAGSSGRAQSGARWDGRDESGARVPSGTYFCLPAGGKTAGVAPARIIVVR